MFAPKEETVTNGILRARGVKNLSQVQPELGTLERSTLVSIGECDHFSGGDHLSPAFSDDVLTSDRPIFACESCSARNPDRRTP